MIREHLGGELFATGHNMDKYFSGNFDVNNYDANWLKAFPNEQQMANSLHIDAERVRKRVIDHIRAAPLRETMRLCEWWDGYKCLIPRHRLSDAALKDAVLREICTQNEMKGED